MKKILLIITICILLSIVSVKSYNRYKELQNDNSYNIYTVSIDNLNTENFTNYFKNIEVVKIYPQVNPVYKNILGNISYKFSSNNIQNEINSFKKYYLSAIKKNSYSDYDYLYFNGINIDKVSIYTSGNELYKFLTTTGAVLN